MLGHTDKATINQRRPLTPGMRELLATVVQKGRMQKVVMTGIEENRMRALVDRGLVTWHIEFRGYQPTEAGRAALTS
jgi:hypothetical protein